MLCGPFYLASVILRPLGSAYGRTKTGVKRIHMKNNLTIIYTYTRIGHEYHHLIKATIRQSHNYDCIGRRGIYETYYFSPTHISSSLVPLDVLFQQNSVLIDSTPLQPTLSTTTMAKCQLGKCLAKCFPSLRRLDFGLVRLAPNRSRRCENKKVGVGFAAFTYKLDKINDQACTYLYTLS